MINLITIPTLFLGRILKLNTEKKSLKENIYKKNLSLKLKILNNSKIFLNINSYTFQGILMGLPNRRIWFINQKIECSSMEIEGVLIIKKENEIKNHPKTSFKNSIENQIIELKFHSSYNKALLYMIDRKKKLDF
ncbi:hypothetical protein (nucleomorph) [Guillardia theta]|uniref:Uncharacterized protein n=1 Tax=Guillardia theta TaxID=55529 RepID=Q98S84_GUITH|nr:hypothetical protein GTHECHR3054 [Guillardia theta]AAK39698.1 hypothetical protein [Guillardia theta]